jgi:hypothetical protein
MHPSLSRREGDDDAMGDLSERDSQARREWGEKMGREGEPVTNPNVSEDFKAGYRKGSFGFGSNVSPKNFGRTGDPPPDWECPFCHHENKGTVRHMRAKRLVCSKCGIEKGYGEDQAPD